MLVVWQGDLSVPGAGWGSAILPSVVHASPVGRAYVGRQGRCLLDVSVRCGSSAAGGSAGRWTGWVCVVLVT